MIRLTCPVADYTDKWGAGAAASYTPALYPGIELGMTIEKTQKCPVCDGLGKTHDGHPCTRCHGKGEVSVSEVRRATLRAIGRTDTVATERRVPDRRLLPRQG